MKNKIPVNKITVFVLLFMSIYVIGKPIFNFIFKFFFLYDVVGISVSLSEKIMTFLSFDSFFYFNIIYNTALILFISALSTFIFKTLKFKSNCI